MLWLKSVHIGAVVIWLGNFVLTGMWSLRAFASRKPEVRAFAVREIVFTDIIFTLGAGSIVVASGIALSAAERVPVLQTLWTRIPLFAVIVAGLVWLSVLLPMEIWMLRQNNRPPRNFGSVFTLWNIIGWAITAGLFVIVYVMVRKPT